VTTDWTRIYGLGNDQVDGLLKAQGNACAICKRRSPTDVDHDHATGDIRGLLCGGCNKGLGLFRDDPALLTSAAVYLQRPPAVAVHEHSASHVCGAPCPGRERLVVWHVEERLNFRAIAERLGVGPSAALGYLADHNVPRRTRGHVCGRGNRCPGVDRLRQLYDRPMSLQQVGDALGISAASAGTLLRIHGIQARRSGPPAGHVCGRGNRCPGPARLAELRADHSLEAVGRLFGVTGPAVSRWMSMHD
jgi:hypothetical protein